jgi:alpha-glucosidase
MRFRPLGLPSPTAALLLALTVQLSPAAWSAPSRLNMRARAVDASTYHLLAYPSNNPVPPPSPFPVLRADWAGARAQITPTGSSVRAASSTIILNSTGSWQLHSTGRPPVHLTGTVTTKDGNTVFTLKHPPGERFYGAGNEGLDRSGPLTHPSGTQLTLNGATRIPFLWSTSGYSVFIANNLMGTSWEDRDGTLTWTIPAPYADVYLSLAPDGYGLLDAFSRLTGRAPIPPRWTFGFMMSRWGYADAADVRDKWQQFRDRRIPVDTFIYDYDWFVNDWDFNPQTFPPGTVDAMHRMGLRFIGIRKPRLNETNLDFAKKQGWVLSSPYGTDLRFDIPEAAAWWWSRQAPLVAAGADGWWNDEAEQTMDEFFQMSRVQWNGWRQMSSRRAWVINRTFSPGIQRFGAATWTGDINTRWDVLANQPGILLNWSLAGMPYTSYDNGGFHGNPSPELYTRWVQSSVFIPVMRSHGIINTTRWPWAFGAEAEAAIKKAIEIRYRLIPYLYTFAEQNARTGAPLMRPLLLEFPRDPATFDLRDQWLLGDRLLAAPVLSESGQRDVYLPAGGWFDFNTGVAIAGGRTLHLQVPFDSIPAYVRAGTILPLGPVMQSTSLGTADPLEVRVYPGADASFSLYEDYGDNYDYQRGSFTRIPMRWNDRTKTLTTGDRIGSYPGMLTTRRLIVTLPGQPSKTANYTGRSIKVKF